MEPMSVPMHTSRDFQSPPTSRMIWISVSILGWWCRLSDPFCERGHRVASLACANVPQEEVDEARNVLKKKVLDEV